MIEMVSLGKRIAVGACVSSIFALFGVSGWLELLQSTPVEMTLVDVKISERYARQPGAKSPARARIAIKARYMHNGGGHVCARAFLFDSMATTEQSAERRVQDLSAKTTYTGRAITAGGSATDCWLISDWKFPAAIAALGFFLGFFLVRE